MVRKGSRVQFPSSALFFYLKLHNTTIRMERLMNKGKLSGLLPIAVFLAIFIGGGVALDDFYRIPAIVAFVIALGVALIQNHKLKISEKLEIAFKSMGNENVMTMCLIFILAGAFSGTVSAAGGVDSTVNFALSVMPVNVSVAGLFLIVISNLLSNASKFSYENGIITLIVDEIETKSPRIARYRIIVEDNGIGISKKYIDRIFDPFVREQGNEIEGTGLGLSIVKSILNSIGGIINVESEERKGTRFTIEVENRISSDENISAKEYENANEYCKMCRFDGERVLLIEDNPINVIVAVSMLEKINIVADTAVNGREGYDKFMSSNNGYYKVVLMDIQMPGLDGYETTKMIRRSPHPQAETIPIIAMTANIFPEDEEKARKAGMSGYIGKPINIAKLCSIIKENYYE